LIASADAQPVIVSLEDVAIFCQAGKLRRRRLKKDITPQRMIEVTDSMPQTIPKSIPEEVPGRGPPDLGGGQGQVGDQPSDDTESPDLPELLQGESSDEEEESPATEWDMEDHLTVEQKSELQELLDEFRDVFAFDMSEMTMVQGEKFKIPVKDETPIFRHQYRLSYAEKDILKEQMDERLKCGFIRPSTSQWAAPVTMPPKKDENGNWTLKRPCGDYRALNKVSVSDHYQLPTPEKIFDQLSGATIFTTLDLRWGYHQVAIDEDDCCKTAFWGPDGLYEWVVMPFGLKNAPAFFQRLMDTTLRAQYQFCRCYIDDVIIFSKSFDEHLVPLRAVLERLRAKLIRCHPKKMKLAVPDVEYLGHFVVPNGTAPQQVKVEAILKMKPPGDVSELRAFLGTAGYYRRYVQNYSRIAAALNRLLQNGVA
jgi:hypothetical protein